MLLSTEIIRAGWKVCSKNKANQAAWGYTLERTPVTGWTGNFHLAVPAASPSCHSQWSELMRRIFLDVTGELWVDCMETSVYCKQSNPEMLWGAISGSHCLSVIRTTLLTGWKPEKEPEDHLFLLLSVIDEHPYCILSDPNISKNKQLAVRLIRQN